MKGFTLPANHCYKLQVITVSYLSATTLGTEESHIAAIISSRKSISMGNEIRPEV
jgi:hypothetical protein